MKISTADIAMGLNFIVLVALVVVLGLLFYNANEAQEAAETVSLTCGLAQELRVSSDDLTRFIRTYTVTGNSSYWDYFQEVIRIRDGNASLPVEPWRIFFDLYIADGREPRPRTAPSAFRDRAIQAGFTEEELEFLEESKRQSDALIDVEDVAAHAMLGQYRTAEPGAPNLSEFEKSNYNITGAPNQTWAMELVHSNFYHHWKGEIMRPLDKFTAASNDRVNQNLKSVNTLTKILLGVLGASIGILIIILLLYVFKLRKDQETSQLLNAVLPSHISNAVSVADVNILREQASAHAKMIRRQNHSMGTSRRMDLLMRRKSTINASNNSNVINPLVSDHGNLAAEDEIGSNNNKKKISSPMLPIATSSSSFLHPPPSASASQSFSATTAVASSSSLSSSSISSRFPVLFHEHVPLLWISFIDMVSFTSLSSICTSGAIVSMLNELFALMDAACVRFKIVKIKTIGDCFMSVKIPRLSNTASSSSSSKNENKNTSSFSLTDKKNIARCGFDMLRFIFHSFDLVHSVALPFDFDEMKENQSSTTKLPTELELRAGLHAGDCSAGVVGFDKFLYDVFGSQINMAARLESSSRPSHVHCTADVFALVEEFHKFIHLVPDDEGGRRTVFLKGVGEVDTVLISNVHEKVNCSRDRNNDFGTVADEQDAISFEEMHSRRSSMTATPQNFSFDVRAVTSFSAGGTTNDQQKVPPPPGVVVLPPLFDEHRPEEEEEEKSVDENLHADHEEEEAVRHQKPNLKIEGDNLMD